VAGRLHELEECIREGRIVVFLENAVEHVFQIESQKTQSAAADQCAVQAGKELQILLLCRAQGRTRSGERRDRAPAQPMQVGLHQRIEVR
jgi:hypothetical protein